MNEHDERNERNERDLARIKQATREMHEAIQDAKNIQRELSVTITLWRDNVKEMVEEATQVELNKLAEATREAIDKATEMVFKRFDVIMEELLGETRRARRKHGASLPDQFKRILSDDENE